MNEEIKRPFVVEQGGKPVFRNFGTIEDIKARLQAKREAQVVTEREKQLYRYVRAFDRGDLDTISDMLKLAETDPVLEQMISEANEVFAEEEWSALSPEAREKAQQDIKELLEQWKSTH